MELTPNLHAFLWTMAGANNCNTYLIRAKEKTILIDPGHMAHFDHVRKDLQRIGLSLEKIDLVIGTHAHPDHIEAVRFSMRCRPVSPCIPTNGTWWKKWPRCSRPPWPWNWIGSRRISF